MRRVVHGVVELSGHVVQAQVHPVSKYGHMSSMISLLKYTYQYELYESIIVTYINIDILLESV